MRGDAIDPDHHLVRNVSPAKLRRAVQDDGSEVVVGFLHTAFAMRPADDYLSASWQEFFTGTPPEQIAAAVREMRNSPLTIKRNSGFAIGQVGAIRAACSSQGHQVRIIHEPEDGIDAHASVRRYPRDDEELFELLAAGAWCGLVLNADIAD